jgi:predicted DsbA family dithiol-disulfide isomerase
MISVAPGTVVVFADIGCPWAHAAIHRFREARARRGLEDRVTLDVRAFPLELYNRRPTPKLILDAEIPVVGALAPEAGWQMWQRPEYEYPVTMLPAMEAVHAAKEQSLRVSEDFDSALRRAFFGESKVVALRDVLLEIAGTVEGLDVDALAEALDSGRARRRILEDKRTSEQGGVEGSPHFFFADGTHVHNPGVQMHWEGNYGRGFPVVDKYDPDVYEDLLDRAAHS